jgi:type III restriction enzyme
LSKGFADILERHWFSEPRVKTMPKAVIAYDKDLPEIPDRRPWEKPTSFLVRGEEPGSWQVDDSGRRPSNLLLVNKLRTAVDAWREQGYPGASDVTQRLFEYWFEEDHEVPGFLVPFRYYFCQREAIETLAYVVEVAQIRDAKSPSKKFLNRKRQL